MTTQRRLIVNADDFGRSDGINAGILEAHRHGIVSSATLMVNYAAAPRAVAAAPESLGLGLHLALTGGPPSLPPLQIPSLVDAEGRLPPKPEGLAQAQASEILAEARAQLARFREIAGRDPTHFDSHHHSHRLAAVLGALVTLALETGRPVRCPSEPMAEQLRSRGIRTPDSFVETFYGDGATLEGLLRILSGLPQGVTELMCHPAVVDDELRRGSSYAEIRQRELEVLTHPRVRSFLKSENIALVSFADL